MLMTLWVIFPSPLMVGGDLPSADAWTLSLLTNPEVIEVDQHSTANHPVINTDKTAVWLANAGSGEGQYVAIFNLSVSNATLRFEWSELGLRRKTYTVRDLWEHKDLDPSSALTVTLPSHGSVLYRVSPVRSAAR
jgi:alpha-galactosidase